jgi:hypothetical protein
MLYIVRSCWLPIKYLFSGHLRGIKKYQLLGDAIWKIIMYGYMNKKICYIF